MPTALTDARPEFINAALAYVGSRSSHPGHYAVMFDKSLYDAADPDLVAAADRRGRRAVGRASAHSTTHAPRATRMPQRSRHGLWCMAFRCCGSTRPIDTDADPIATVERVARMLFRRG